MKKWDDGAVQGGVENGVRWCVKRTPIGTAYNGYAEIPAGHPWQHMSCDDIEETGLVDVHGGLTKFAPQAPSVREGSRRRL